MMTSQLEMTPHSGLLKEEILFDRQESRSTPDGNLLTEWVPYASIPACIMPILPKGGLELWQAEKKVYPTRYRVWIRAVHQVHVNMRAIWRGEVFRFLTAPVLNQRRTWTYFIIQSTGQMLADNEEAI